MVVDGLPRVSGSTIVYPPGLRDGLDLTTRERYQLMVYMRFAQLQSHLESHVGTGPAKKKILQGLRRVRSWPSCGKADDFLGKGTREGARTVDPPSKEVSARASACPTSTENGDLVRRSESGNPARDARMSLSHLLNEPSEVPSRKRKQPYTPAGDRDISFIGLAVSRKMKKAIKEREYIYRRRYEFAQEKSRLGRLLTHRMERGGETTWIRQKISQLDKKLSEFTARLFPIESMVFRYKNEVRPPPELIHRNTGGPRQEGTFNILARVAARAERMAENPGKRSRAFRSPLPPQRVGSRTEPVSYKRPYRCRRTPNCQREPHRLGPCESRVPR